MSNNPLNSLVVWFFGMDGMALILAFAILSYCGYLIWRTNKRYHHPFTQAVRRRNAALQFLNEAPSIDEAPMLFAQRLPEVDEAMSQIGPQTDELCHAWREFRETILDETESPLRATNRPEGYFLHLGDDTRALAWWANIFVAIGLTFTFLGIVAALTVTVESLHQSADGNMADSLIKLLEITSVKFWTSIAGVGASIILRFFDKRWHGETMELLEQLCDYLERGTVFSPPQRIAADQLRQLEQQTIALSDFSTKLATSIGDAFQERMTPMVTVLNGIQSSIDSFKSDGVDQFGKQMGDALSRHAGAEMQQLASAIGGMANNFSVMQQRLESMPSAYQSLSENLASIGQRMNSESEAMSQRHADILGNAVAALESSTARASEQLTASVDAAVTRAAEQSGKVMDQAFEKFGTQFDQASQGLVETVRTAAAQMERIAISIERSTSAAERHAETMVKTEQAATGMRDTMIRAATDLEKAAVPVRDATNSISQAITKVQEAILNQSDGSARQVELMQTMGRELTATSQAASKAWSEYRERFEEVDRALGVALNSLRDATSEHTNTLMEQTGKVDIALASAIDSLHPMLDPLRDLAENLENVLGQTKKAS